jgi:16S rRNA (guanine527-N7)-methyltransferase
MEKMARAALELFGIRLTGRQMVLLAAYERELLAWNEKINLTAIRDAEGIRIKHFLDSFSCVLAWKENPPVRLIDVGTGAGFPGIPLKILYPSMQLTLVESVGKKTAFCRHVAETLKLGGVEVLTSRAEAVGQLPDHREAYQWAVARAVANLSSLVEYLLPLVRVGGSVIAQKGPSGPAEAHAAEKAMRILGGRMRQVIPVTLPTVVEERFLVVVDKVAATPPQYPRHPGMPVKRPLQ